jgi:pyruvate dehydrogenase E1 component
MGSERMATATDDELALLDRIQKKVLWLSTWMVHHANNIRPNPDGTKVGGHQASSASVVSLLTALYFRALGPGDAVAVKAHASPAFYAIQYLRGRLAVDDLQALRSFGGLQAYPSRRKNPDIVELSTGSMGLGAVLATFGGLAARYLVDHGAAARLERMVVMAGDAELDEGNVWEALGEEAVRRLGNALWIVDVNRQSLDRIVPDPRTRQIADLFRASGWNVVELRWGSRLQALFARADGDRLRARMDALSHGEYHRLMRGPASDVRKALVAPGGGKSDRGLDRFLAAFADDELAGLFADVGGHDLRLILDALDVASRERERPTVILAHTIKGWGTPLAADPLNHTALLSTGQVEELRARLAVAPGDEWAGFAPDSSEAALVRALPRLFGPASSSAPAPAIPDTLEERYPDETSTQEAFGRVLGALGRLPVGERVVTVSADVAVTTHLAGWINRKGIYFPETRANPFADTMQAMQWRESPAGQHVELGIAEHNLFLLLGALGLTAELSGELLLPIGTLYDPCRPREEPTSRSSRRASV